MLKKMQTLNEELKRKYQGKLLPKNVTLRLKGENYLMRKNSVPYRKTSKINAKLKSMLEKQQQLYEKIKGLERHSSQKRNQ